MDGSAYDDLRILEEDSELVQDPLAAEVDMERENDNTDTDDDNDDGEEDGMAAGPVQEENGEILDNVQYTGVGLPHQRTNELANIRRDIEPRQPTVVPWPEREEEPLDEYNTTYLLTRSFPCLFPFGAGDITNKIRHKSISYHDGAQHYLWYAVCTEGVWSWPMAQNHRFIHYIQDVDERHRVQSQASVYMMQNR